MFLKSTGPDRYLFASMIDLKESASTEARSRAEVDTAVRLATVDSQGIKGVDLSKAVVEVRQVSVQQVHVDGRPVGPAVPISR